MSNSSRSLPSPFVVGMGTLSFGMVCGFSVTALPFLLSKNGVPVDRIATVSAVAMSPTFWGFLVNPIIDVALTRRTYAFGLTAVSAACLASALWLFSPDRLGLFSVLVLLAELAIVLQSNAAGGWASEFVPDNCRGRVGGWTNVANLGGGAAGAMMVMTLSEFLSLRALGALMGLAVVTSSLFLLRFPPPAKPQLGLAQIFGGTFRSIVRTSRQPEVLTGFMLFLAPASAVAAINLFSGLGKDFHALPQNVVWITGAGVAISSSAGSIVGGYLADRVSRSVLYLSGGILAGLCSLFVVCTPHTAAVFAFAALTYNAIAGLTYAAFTSLELQLVGHRNPTAATQLALFAASTNAAVVYMTWFDGQGYRIGGVRGLFLVDGLASIGAAVSLLLFVSSRARRTRVAPPISEALAEEA